MTGSEPTNINGPTMYAEFILPIGGIKESGWALRPLVGGELSPTSSLITVHHGKPSRTL